MPANKKKAALEGGKSATKKKAPKKPAKSRGAKKSGDKKAPKKQPAKKTAAAVKPKEKQQLKNPPSKTGVAAKKAVPKTNKKPKAKAKPKKKSTTFKPGNKMWNRRNRAGPLPKYDDPEVLWAAAVRYFEWALKNPVEENKIFCSFGDITLGTLKKTRALTNNGLCIELGISLNTWATYRESDLLKEVCSQIADIIYEQKFSGAAAGIFNSSIITRDLGLIDKREEVLIPKNKPGTLADFYASLDKDAEPEPAT